MVVDDRNGQIAAFDRTVDTLTKLVGLLADAASVHLARLLALQHVLVEQGLVTDAVVTAKMQEFDRGAAAGFALAPEYESFWEIRRQIRAAGEVEPLFARRFRSKALRLDPEAVTSILNESIAVCGGCGADPRAGGVEAILRGWFFDLVQTREGLTSEVRCPQCW